MSNEVMTRPQGNDLVTREALVSYLDSFGMSGLKQEEKTQFIEIAQAFGLNPFKREIYCIPYGEGDKRKLSILTGFEVYLKRAERSNLLDGWKVWTEGSIACETITKEFKGKNGNNTWTKDVKVWKGDLKAVIEIFRKDRTRPFVHEVYFTEYTQDNDMWGGKPQTMIKKVVMGQGFRLCFPDELAGMPYTADELPDEMTTLQNVTPEPATVQPKTAKAEEIVYPKQSAKPAEKPTEKPAQPKPAPVGDERLTWPLAKIVNAFGPIMNNPVMSNEDKALCKQEIVEAKVSANPVPEMVKVLDTWTLTLTKREDALNAPQEESETVVDLAGASAAFDAAGTVEDVPADNGQLAIF